VILLSKGKLIYQGSRELIESFFEFAGYPTPANFNPADHYVTAVNDEFRLHELSVDEWAQKYCLYREKHSPSHSALTSSMVVARSTSQILARRSKSPFVVFELTRRYFLNLWFNPGILATRIAMYSMLALMVGALFWNLGERRDFESVQSRAAVLFYCVAFFVFMSVAVLPFTVMERGIVDKEVRNSYYPSVAYQLAQAIASIPGAAILASVVTVIITTMTKVKAPYWYLLNMFLSLVCAEALAQMVSHIVPHFVIGMALLAGLYGFFMLFMGFMLAPSHFPSWLRWTYDVPFHSYSWRTFMHFEFCCQEDAVFEGPYSTGQQILDAYEIGDVNPTRDLIVIACYSLVIHLLSLLVLYLRYNAFHGKLEQPRNGLPAQMNAPSREVLQDLEEPLESPFPIPSEEFEVSA
jgi:ABC-type multidrug transport system permease subunit